MSRQVHLPTQRTGSDMTRTQPTPKQSEREASEKRNIILARSRLALLYARRKQISQSMVDAIGIVLEEQAKEVF